MVDAVMNNNLNYLTARERELFKFLDTVNHDSPGIRDRDVRVLKDFGWSDDAIFTAITVCSLFNFYNRWCDANGVHPLTPEGYEMSGKRLATGGYKR